MKNYLWNDLFSFINIVDAGSFTKAAEKIGLSPSVLSKRIRRLEADLNITLFQRNTRKLFLTEAGKQCYAKMACLQHQFEQVIENIGDTQKNLRGKLRISAPFSFGQMHLSQAIFEFMEIYPEIQIDLLLGQSTTHLIEKNIDIGIFIKELPDSRLVARRISQRKITVCGSPVYFKQYGLPRIPQELSQHNCLLYYTDRLSHQWQFQKAGRIFSVEVKGNFAANSTQVLAQAAIAGKGIVKLPGYSVREALQQGKLISILEAYCLSEIGIYAAYPFTRNCSMKVKVFVNFLAEKFKYNLIDISKLQESLL